jgi:hypothetical protein
VGEVGALVGALVGASVGTEVGASVGALVGTSVLWSPLTLVINTASLSTATAFATEVVNDASDAGFVDVVRLLPGRCSSAIQAVRGIKMIAFTRTVLSANAVLEGCEVGVLDGVLVGFLVGTLVGAGVGASVGTWVGEKLGAEVGEEVGAEVG